MKRFLFLAALFSSFISGAQQSTEAAFSKSYSFEYDGQYSKAIISLTELNTYTYQINLRLGWLYYLNKDYAAAETFYKKAIAQEHNSIEARLGLVLPMAAQSNWNSVLSTYMEIIKIDPNNSVANYRTSVIYYYRKDYANATTYIARVLKLYPFDFDSNLMMGKILIALGKSAEAKKYVGIAVQYNPLSEEAKTLLKKL